MWKITQGHIDWFFIISNHPTMSFRHFTWLMSKKVNFDEKRPYHPITWRKSTINMTLFDEWKSRHIHIFNVDHFFPHWFLEGSKMKHFTCINCDMLTMWIQKCANKPLIWSSRKGDELGFFMFISGMELTLKFYACLFS